MAATFSMCCCHKWSYWAHTIKSWLLPSVCAAVTSGATGLTLSNHGCYLQYVLLSQVELLGSHYQIMAATFSMCCCHKWSYWAHTIKSWLLPSVCAAVTSGATGLTLSNHGCYLQYVLLSQVELLGSHYQIMAATFSKCCCHKWSYWAHTIKSWLLPSVCAAVTSGATGLTLSNHGCYLQYVLLSQVELLGSHYQIMAATFSMCCCHKWSYWAHTIKSWLLPSVCAAVTRGATGLTLSNHGCYLQYVLLSQVELLGSHYQIMAATFSMCCCHKRSYWAHTIKSWLTHRHK